MLLPGHFTDEGGQDTEIVENFPEVLQGVNIRDLPPEPTLLLTLLNPRAASPAQPSEIAPEPPGSPGH